MDTPTIAEERMARIIAYQHGSKVLFYKDGAKTVAHLAGFDSGWAWEYDKYADRRWQEYVPAARAVLAMR